MSNNTETAFWGPMEERQRMTQELVDEIDDLFCEAYNEQWDTLAQYQSREREGRPVPDSAKEHALGRIDDIRRLRKQYIEYLVTNGYQEVKRFTIKNDKAKNVLVGDLEEMQGK